jgi:hypothetical protein
MATYGLPYFLEDKTGKLTGSEFIDIHDRLRLSYRRTTEPSAAQTAYMIFNSGRTPYPGAISNSALIALAFGSNNDLGTISFSSRASVPMKKYLVKVSSAGRYVNDRLFFRISNLLYTYSARKFVASDGQEYSWSWRTQANQEWTVCVAFSSSCKPYLCLYVLLSIIPFFLRSPSEN